MEKQLVLYCAPTLAGIKAANLFRYSFLSEAKLADTLSYTNETLNPKGVYAEAVRIRENHALIYVYRATRLATALQKEGVSEFLSGYNYPSSVVEDCISHLKKRFHADDSFPHEIGLFLGYPLLDVVGFIENEGKNSICAGCWKVYHNELEAMRLFAQYKKCKHIYVRLYLQGRPFGRMIVAA